MEIEIVETILEMLRDREYTFPEGYEADKILGLSKDSKYREIIAKIPYINNKIEDTRMMVIDDKGIPVYVYMQEGNEETNGFGDTQPERQAIAKQIANNLKAVYPEMSGVKKLGEIYDLVHLIVVFNGSKYDLMKIEQESFQIYNFEAFPKKRLRFNVTKHYLSGKTKKLTKEQVQEYKDKFQTTLATMSIYRIDDAIIRYYHGQPGDIFHCIRLKGGETYRLVVKKTIASQEEKNK
jgi:DNA-directed RNA polymerase subunit H (RpoH/RPB5)